MIEATKEGDLGRVQMLLNECPALACCRDSVGQSPLMWASYKVGGDGLGIGWALVGRSVG